jgi:tRNA-2-methylthio-N6-dimethylallyladenosine synthase
MTTGSKTIHIKTYGCQMNFYDSERMGSLMEPLGYQLVDSPESADMVVFNTCHIREKAAEKLYSDLGRLRPLKAAKEAEGGRMVVAVAGCVAQAEGAEVRRRAPYVDIVVGPQTFQKLPDLVAKSLRDHSTSVALDFGVEEKFDAITHSPMPAATQAFVTVQEGCDKFCTFCVVPYTRGAEYSRPVKDVLTEAQQRIAAGAVEITLLGQNVNAYHGLDEEGQAANFAQLIWQLAALKGIQRIRYMTSHPRDMDDALIAAHGDVPELMPYLHLPVQSGSDRILKAMNRKHTAADYLAIIQKLRHVRPDMAFSSDFIVGFPGETEEDFEATLALVREVHFAQCYSFKYSPRPGTPAAEHDAQVPEDVKDDRLARLQALLNEQQRQFNEASVGKITPILIERTGKHAGQMSGRTEAMQLVHMDDCSLPVGSLVNARLTAALGHGLLGELI